jgi:Lon-like ATP-dependent protease
MAKKSNSASKAAGKAVKKAAKTIAAAVPRPGQHKPFPKDYTDTSQLPVSPLLADQIIGQDRAVAIIRKAAVQKRNVLLVGTPGTGKSMLAQAMAELLPVQELEDIIVAYNPEDDNVPKIRVVKAGDARRIQQAERMKAKALGGNINVMLSLFLMASTAIIIFVLPGTGMPINLVAAMLVGMFILGAAMLFASQVGRQRVMDPGDSLKVLIDNSSKKKAPFVDATGAKAGALLGDVRHDPFQSGGLGTPAHLRVEAGFIHKAHKGILFIDEASTLRPKAQQELLTAMQEKKYGITGQSEMSSGALVKTEPVPCDFILVAAGNYQDVARMHPALRSRIRGYGYEVYMEETIEDNEQNRDKFAVFVAQEVTKDGKIPHFSREAVEEILLEAKRRAGRKNKLTLRMRELGGLVRAAGDIARETGARLVEKQHVRDAKKLARTLEQQATQFEIEVRKEYRVFQNEGKSVGRVNGLAVMADAGIALPIVAEMAPASSKAEGKIIATGKLGKIAEEAVKNVSAILKKHLGKDTSNFDIHIQFLQTYEGVEGDSASISVATAVISALEDAPVRQDVAMTGSLSVRGDVLPVGGVTYKAEAALDAGIRTVIVPKANAGDIFLSKERAESLQIIPVSSLYEVLRVALAPSPKKALILSKVKRELR